MGEDGQDSDALAVVEAGYRPELEPAWLEGIVERAAGVRVARERLRAAAIAIDRVGGTLGLAFVGEARAAWSALVDGQWTLLQQFESDGRRYLVARRHAPRIAHLGGLTRAETVCAACAAMGHAQKLIAYELGIAEPTVSTHVRRAMQKLGIATRAELALAFGARGDQ